MLSTGNLSVSQTLSPSARAPHSGRMSQAGGPAIGSVMSGFMKTTRLGSSISRLGVRAGGPIVAGPSYPEPRGTGPLKCGTWKGGFWPATSSAVSRGRPRESPVTRTIPFNPPTRRCGGVRPTIVHAEGLSGHRQTRCSLGTEVSSKVIKQKPSVRERGAIGLPSNASWGD